MKKLTWLFLGNIAAGHASRTTTTGTQDLEVTTGDIFEPAEYLRVTLDGGDSTKETALTLSYVQAERGLVTATVGQVYTSAFQVTFPDGDIQRLQAGTVVRMSNGDLFFSVSSEDRGAVALTAQSFPLSFGGTSRVDDVASVDVLLSAGNGQVAGTLGNDLINQNYVGDPEGDRIDNQDAGGANGELVNSNADLVDASGGDDTVLAGFGNDTILGGDGNDSLDGGTGASRQRPMKPSHSGLRMICPGSSWGIERFPIRRSNARRIRTDTRKVCLRRRFPVCGS